MFEHDFCLGALVMAGNRVLLNLGTHLFDYYLSPHVERSANVVAPTCSPNEGEIHHVPLVLSLGF